MPLPRRDSHLLAAAGVVLLALLWAASEPRADDGPDGMRVQIEKAEKAGANARAVELGEKLLLSKQTLGSAGTAMAEALVAQGNYERAAHLLTEGQVTGAAPDLFNRAGMGLHCGNAGQIKLAVACLKAALAQEPSSIYYRFNLAVTYWNGGYIPEARQECEAVLAKDSGNVQAFQILQRIQKQEFSSKVSAVTGLRRRTVKLQLKADKDAVPMIAGSWNEMGALDQFSGWRPVAMKKVREAGHKALFEHEVSLETEKGRWYSAVVADRAPGEAKERPVSMVRFPVYPVETGPLTVSLDQGRIQAPSPFLVPREDLPGPSAVAAPEDRSGAHASPAAGAAGSPGKPAPPRTILVCIDSETWNILMPLLKAGFMPRLAELMRRGSYGEIHSDPPISTIAFDRISFGSAGTFGWLDWLADSVETLKEKGFDLIHAGNIAGTKNIWKWFAEQGHSSLYISWSEQIFYDKGGKETVEKLDPAVGGVRVGGVTVPSRDEKVHMVLDHEDVPQPVKPTYSDTVAEELIDSGLKRFDEATTLLAKYHPDITFVHFGFIDTSFHLFWDAMDPDMAYLQKGFTAPRRHRNVIANLHRLMDLFIGEFAREIWSQGGNIIVFSDHGATGGFASTWLGHDPIGEIIAAGPSFKPGLVANPRTDIFDIVPTLIAAYGLPANPSYNGRAMASVIGKPSPAHTPSPAPAVAGAARPQGAHGDVVVHPDHAAPPRGE